MIIRIVPFLTVIFFSTIVQGQMYDKGNFVVDVYAGGPNIYSAAVKILVKKVPGFSGLTTRSSLPFGVKAEYLLTQKVGIGLNVNYATSSVNGTYTDSINTNNIPYDVKFSLNRLRVFPTFNVHMGTSEKYDPYFSLGFGYNHTKLISTSNAPRVPSINFNLPIPLAFRVEFGIRYFVTKNLGVHFQTGIGGGALFAVGLSSKF